MKFCFHKRVALVYADRVRDCDAGNPVRDCARAARYSTAQRRIDDVCRHLCVAGFQVTTIAREALSDDIAGFDWILALGGDGTQLDVARFAGTTPVLGLRLFPESSRGFLCSSDYDVFLAQTPGVGDFCHLNNYMRLVCLVNGIPMGRSILNDVLFSQSNPARASRYVLSLGGEHEFQCSSGIWVSTAVGSHGAVRSAGGPTIDCHLRLGTYCVRELATEGDLRQGTFELHTHFEGAKTSGEQGEGLSIIAKECRHKLFFDGGLWECPLAAGDVVTFAQSENDYRQIVM